MDYISKNLDDMTLSEMMELCKNPDKYNLKWGEYVKIIEVVEKAMKMANPQFGGSSDARVQELELRVAKLEQKIANIVSLFAEFYAKNTWDREE